MLILFILLAIVSMVVGGTCQVLHLIIIRGRQIRPFCGNRIGGKGREGIVCRRADYERAIQTGSVIERPGKEPLVIVKGEEALVVNDQPGGDCSWQSVPDLFWKKNLFIPFISEHYISFAKQAEMFTVHQDPREFKERGLLAHYHRKGFAASLARWDDCFPNLRARLITCATVGLGIALVGSLLILAGWVEKSKKAEPLLTTVTEPGGSLAQQIGATQGDRFKKPVLMYENRDDHELYRGTIVKVSSKGGSLAVACLQGDRGQRWDCGTTSLALGLKVGDIAYLREGQTLVWRVNDIGRHEGQFWVITEQEAQALLKTGKFTLSPPRR